MIRIDFLYIITNRVINIFRINIDIIHFFIKFRDDFFDDTSVDFAHRRDSGGDLADLINIKLLHDCAAPLLAQTQEKDRRFLRAGHVAMFAKGYKLVHEIVDSRRLDTIAQG